MVRAEARAPWLPTRAASNWTWNGFGRAVSRILSAPCGGENHLSMQPIPGIRPLSRKLGRAAPWIPYLALHPMGFSVPRRLRFARCALTAPFHHHRRLAPAAVCFLWHFPSARLPTCLPRVSRPNKPGLRGIAPCGVRTFLPRLAPGAILRPSKTINSITQTDAFLKEQWPILGGTANDRAAVRCASFEF